MVLNKQKGNMYEFCQFTYNPIKGKCPHRCSVNGIEYCYMNVFPQKELRLDEKELKTNLGASNTIFCGSSTDMFASVIPEEWIRRVLSKCRTNPQNTYIFQTKNPKRFIKFKDLFPEKIIYGTTLETDKQELLTGNVPTIKERVEYMIKIIGRKFITLEPLVDFNVKELVNLIKKVNPEFVNIGSDSKNHSLPEPNKESIEELIKGLKEFTKVNIKSNLNRLIKQNDK